MDYLVVQVSSDKLDVRSKKAYINSLYGKVGCERKLGFIEKFSRAIGFTGELENTPKDLLIENLYVHFKGEVFMEFYIPRKGILVQEGTNVSITHGQLANKWAKFLIKIYPELKVDIVKSEMEIDRGTFIVSSVFKSIEESSVTIDLTIDSIMNDEEIDSLESLLVELNYKLTVRVLEYECNVCKKRDPNNPIHIEIESGYYKEELNNECENIVLLVSHQSENKEEVL